MKIQIFGRVRRLEKEIRSKDRQIVLLKIQINSLKRQRERMEK